MERLLSTWRQSWLTRTSLRARGSTRERVAGAVLYAAAIMGPLSTLSTHADGRLIITWGIGSLVFVAQGTMLLFTVPSWWRVAADWLHNQASAWIYVCLLVILGFCIVLAGAVGQRDNMGFLAFGLALAMRSAASLTEPNSTSIGERQVLWRLRRAALIHAGFMPVFAFGILVIVASIEHADGQQVPFTWPAGVTVATAAFIFKVHQRMRKVCTLTADRVAQVQTALASLGTTSSGPAAQKAIKDLEVALRTPVQTGYHLWGTPIVTADARQRLIDWLNKQVEDQQPVPDSSDAKYQDLITIASVCSRWTDVAA